MRRTLTPEEREKYSADCANILNSEGFKYIMGVIREDYINELIGVPVGDLRAHTLHASMKVLEDFKTRSELLVNEWKRKG